MNGIDNHIHLIISKIFGHFIAFANGTSVPLLQVAGTPRGIQVMYSNGFFLCIGPCAERLTIKTKEVLMCAVVLWAYKAVKGFVIPLGKALFKLRGLL